MNIFSFNDYKEYVREKIGGLRGHYRKLAQHLRVQTSLISQIFSGTRHLTLEQACLASEFFELGKTETQYFVNLVHLDRAGSEALKDVIREELKRLKQLMKRPIRGQLVDVVSSDEIMNEKEQALFYSHWYYSGVRLASSIEKLQRPDAIARYFNLSPMVVNQVVEFLLSTRLCIEENGKIKMGPKATRVDPYSQLSSRLHVNWRLKAIEKIPVATQDEIFRTRAVSVSKSDSMAIKKLLLGVLNEIDSKIDRSDPEQLSCLNLDWFDF